MMIKNITTTLAIFSILIAPGLAQAGKKPKVKKQVIEAVEGLRYSPVRISMRRGEQLQLKFVNRDPNDQPHNLVIIKPGSLADIQAASMKVGPDSIEKQYVPDHEAVLAAGKLLGPDKSEKLTFTPKNKGIHHFICTFPGHAQVMYGAIYVDQRAPRDITTDPNIPEYVRNLELQKVKKSLEVKRPSVMRAFLPEAGPAAIAVALPDQLNFCWDAGNCRLRYAWTGTFLDPRAMLNSNGNSLAKIMGTQFWSSGGDENTFAIKTQNTKAKPSFKGYRLIDGIPEFRYTLDGLEIHERITSEKGHLRWDFQIKGASSPIRVFSPGVVESTNGTRDGDFLILDPKAAQKFTLKITPSK